MIPKNHNHYGTALKMEKRFINRLKDIAVHFDLSEIELNNLTIAAEKFEALLDKRKLNLPDYQKAKAEKNCCIKEALTAVIALIRWLKKDPKWTAENDKSLQVQMLPPKVNFDGEVWKRKSGVSNYGNEESYSIMDWLKHISRQLKETNNPVWLSKISSTNLDTIIEGAEKALNRYAIVNDNYEAILAELDNSLEYLRTSRRTIMKNLKSSTSWNDEYAFTLNADYLPALDTFKPAAQLVNYIKYIQINFLKNGVSGMNVYSRTQDEINFTLLGYSKRTRFKDPRPIMPFSTGTREYRLNAVLAGKEIGQPSDVLSIKIG